MARKLPWLSNPTSVSTTRQPPTKRRKISPSTDDANITSPDSLHSKSKSRSKNVRPSNQDQDQDRGGHKDRDRARGRTPSTSPPPAPPTIDFIREGIDADDGYLMVEDEFNEIAKTFTAHLHHAEYKRLMKEARERKQVREATGNSVNGSGKDDIQRRKVAHTLHLENNELNNDGEEEESGSEVVMKREEQRVGDPWAGTTLAGLMRYDPGRDRLSLRGLHGVQSGSRAAMGFRSNVSASTRTNHEDPLLRSINSKHERGGLPLPAPIKIKKEKEVKRETDEQQRRTLPSALSNGMHSGTRHNPTTATATATMLDNPTSDTSNFNTAKNTRLNTKINKIVKVKEEEMDTTTNSSSRRPEVKSKDATIVKSEHHHQQYPAPPPPNKKYDRAPVRKFIDDLDDFDHELFERNNKHEDEDRDKNGDKVKTSSPRMYRPIAKETKIKKEEGVDGDGDSKDVTRKKRLSDRLDEVPVFLA